MFMVLDFILKGTFTFFNRSGPNRVQETNRGAKGRLHVSVCCTWKIPLIVMYQTCCVLLVCEALWRVLWSKSTGLSLSAQRGHRDLVETVWWAELHKYCMSNYYYVEWVKRSIRVCEVGQMKVKLYTHCTSPLLEKKWIQTWETEWLWAEENKKRECGRKTKTERWVSQPTIDSAFIEEKTGFETWILYCILDH